MNDQTPETASRGDRSQPESRGSTQDAAQNIDQKVRALEAERTHLGQKVLEIQAEQQELLGRLIRLEEQNSTLTTLYVACQRLHSSLDQAEVLLTVREVIANLVGCEEYVLFSVAPDGWLDRVDSFGVDPETYERVALGSGLIGRTVETGEAFLREEGGRSAATEDDAHLTACIPLKRNGAVTGAIALFRLLPQKLEIQELDRELFWLLETHLARALYCAELAQGVSNRNGVTA
jgi:nitrate/nitrite-specific signal transduction histidine kinase